MHCTTIKAVADRIDKVLAVWVANKCSREYGAV